MFLQTLSRSPPCFNWLNSDRTAEPDASPRNMWLIVNHSSLPVPCVAVGALDVWTLNSGLLTHIPLHGQTGVKQRSFRAADQFGLSNSSNIFNGQTGSETTCSFRAATDQFGLSNSSNIFNDYDVPSAPPLRHCYRLNNNRHATHHLYQRQSMERVWLGLHRHLRPTFSNLYHAMCPRM